LLSIIIAFVIINSSIKRVSPNTEFCFPGVPPILETDALQLFLPSQKRFGFTLSILQPPSFLFSSLYHLSV